MARHIDWRRQFSKLKPYLDGNGGGVNVRYRGAGCGANAFLSILKAEFQHRPSAAKPDGASIRLDSENYKVRFLGGIRGEFARILRRQALMKPMPSGLVVDGTLLSNNTSGGAQSIEANFHFDDSPHLAAERNEWVSLLASELQEYLKTGRFMIILLGGSTDEQAEFWSSIWAQASELTQKGLLLVRMIDDESPHANSLHDACAHDCEVTLSPSLDGDAVTHAIEDVAAFIQDQLPDQDLGSSEVLAKGYVLSNRHNVSMLHNRLCTFMDDLEDY